MNPPLHVLVVDDDEDIREVVRRGLELDGFVVTEAADGPDALAKAAVGALDVAILDLHMPGMSGLDVLTGLRARLPELHVIMLSGSGTEEDRVRGLIGGADDYMVKPFSPRELAARVLAAGRRRRAATPPEGPSTTADALGNAERAGGPDAGSPDRLPAFVSTTSADATVVVAGEGIVYASPAAADLVGAARPDDLVGHPVLEFVAEQSIGAAIARQESLRLGRRVRPEVLTLTRHDGGEVLVEVSSAPVMWDGAPASELTLWDLSDDRSKVRELAIGIQSDVPDAVIVTDTDLRIQSFNPAAEELYGWSEQEVTGRVSLEVVPWVDQDSSFGAVEEAFRRDGRWHGVMVQRRRDGNEVTVRSSATLLRDSAGQAVGIVSVNRAIKRSDGAASPVAVDSALAAEIRRAIDHGELVLHYQPVVSLDDGRWLGAEALVRWQHPERGLLAPAAFIDAAEASGAIVDIGRFVLEEACRQWETWSDGGHDIYMAVNLSARQLADPHLVDHLAALIDQHSIPAGRLWMEVTETALVADLDQATTVLDRIAALGVCLSIDDFGTGWASLTYLRQFPIKSLKIDRVFVAGLGTGSNDQAIIGSIISLGAELGLAVVAEGIETSDQHRTLRGMGCAVGQGYLFARPQPADSLDPDSAP